MKRTQNKWRKPVVNSIDQLDGSLMTARSDARALDELTDAPDGTAVCLKEP
jgi:hypothetical protein